MNGWRLAAQLLAVSVGVVVLAAAIAGTAYFFITFALLTP